MNRLLYACVENHHCTLLKTNIIGWGQQVEGLDLHAACHFNLAVFYDYEHPI